MDRTTQKKKRKTMANPVFVDCPADTWTKVATNVVVGQIKRVITVAKYLGTYRTTGDSAPTLQSEGSSIFLKGNSGYEKIEAKTGIDVYIFSIRKAGRVRVDV